ncbi:hypothetical protein [Trinickia acidisoli]|uniref:hypothetical protein n=1 Tax=Trinickia acidisoli TaxID=2767482 RepID=UPI001A90BAB6|nr:hypothetical protein [Trinickia acidisoli]
MRPRASTASVSPAGSTTPTTPLSAMVHRKSSYSNEVVSSEDSSDVSLQSPPVRKTTREWLADLDAASTSTAVRRPLMDVVTRYPKWDGQKPIWARSSKEIGGSNYDCVLAAFRSAKGKTLDESAVSNLNTSEDRNIRKVAQIYGMREIKGRDLKAQLPNVSPNEIDRYTESNSPKHRRAFIQTPALDNAPGRYHAYAAIGIDSETDKVIAWDPDADHLDLKLVPLSLIEMTFI